VLTLSASPGGSISAAPDQVTYTEGQVVTVTATADPGFAFIGWGGDLAGTTNPESLLMLDDATVSANFAVLTTHTLTLNAVGDGSVAADPASSPYTLGDLVTLTATPAAGSVFTGWSGDLSGSVNPAQLTITGDLSVTANFEIAIYIDDFGSGVVGDDPVNWYDSAANNSLTEDDTLFAIKDVGGDNAFGTTSTATNIHSHYNAVGSDTLTNYSYSGRMRISASNGAIGVTFLSEFPATAAYYRLRRYAGRDFHLSPFGTSVSGTTATGVTPDPNSWYRFLIEVQDTGLRTEIRAKVWKEGETEPASWQVDAFDDTPSRLTVGTFGVWSFSAGAKYWDDLDVRPLP
jgi:hypothetical protein